MDVSFTADESWSSPFYELYVEVGPHPAALANMSDAFGALWNHPTLDGPYADGSLEPAGQPKVDVADYVSEEAGHMLGVATLPDTNRAPCGCVPHIPDLAFALGLSDEIHEGLGLEYGPEPLEPGPDAFTFYVPGGALERLYAVDLMLDELQPHLQRAFDDWLVDIAQLVFEQSQFTVAAIGPEGSYNPERLDESGANILLRPRNGEGLEVLRQPS